MMEFRTSDHPEAVGRTGPTSGLTFYATFQLEGGGEMKVWMGERSWLNFRREILTQQMKEAANEALDRYFPETNP